MPYGINLVIGPALSLALLTQQASFAGELPRPPVAQRKPVTVQHHGVTLTDDYGWLRTAKPPELLDGPAALEPHIRKHLEAERRYAHAMLAPNRSLERRILAEMRARVSGHDETVPEAWGSWEYYTRYRTGAQRRLHCRRPRGGGPEQIMLDENLLARGRQAFSVSDVAVSPNHQLLAYSFDADGSERNTLKIRDLVRDRDLADTIHEVRGGGVWSLDSEWLFYVRRDAAKWGQKVYRHRLSTRHADDQLVYEEMEEGFTVSLRSTLSTRFLVIETSDFSTSDVKLVDLAHPQGQPQTIVDRKQGDKYAVTDRGDRLILLTNADGATDWKIGEKALTAPAGEPLERIVPHVTGHLIEDFVVYRDHLVWQERDREQGGQRIVIRRWSDGAEHAISFGEQPAKIDVLAGREQNTRTLRYSYQSMVQPKQVFDYDMDTRQRTLRKFQDVPSGHDPARYVTRRLEAPTHDGARIPMTVLYLRDTPLDGSAPVWLHAYGAYGEIQYPEFGTERLSLVNRRFIYAVAHVRGGGEKGEAWHDAGRLGNKMNSVHDFITVAEHLIGLGMTRPGRIVASGASAGGTLVGAAANMRPELFGAVYAEAPFVDALNTLLDRTLPLTESSFSEFGNPADSRADFLNIQAYSPYENVRAQAYPPMLIFQSLNDTRVQYWESAKWTAKLRQLNTGNNPVILFLKMRGGHSGGSGRFDTLVDYARAYAFGIATSAADPISRHRH